MLSDFSFGTIPPAKIFMGDVGSGFLGYTLAVIAVASALRDIFRRDSGATRVAWGAHVSGAPHTRILAAGPQMAQPSPRHAYSYCD
jgi:glycosyl transferase family 4